MPYFFRTLSMTSYVSSFNRPVSSVKTFILGSSFVRMSISTTSSEPKDEASAIFEEKFLSAHCNSATAEDFSCSLLSFTRSNGTGVLVLDLVQNDATAQDLLLTGQHKTPGRRDLLEDVERDRFFRMQDDFGDLVFGDL